MGEVEQKEHSPGLDLDPEPSGTGKKNHFSLLSSDQKRRLKILEKKMLISVTLQKLISSALVIFHFTF